VSRSLTCGLTILRTTGFARATKRWSWNPTLQEWRKISYSAGARFTAEECPVASLTDLAAVLERVSRDPRAFVVRGSLSQSARDDLAQNGTIRRRKHHKNNITPTLAETPRQWVMIDIDNWPLPTWGDLADDPDTVIEHAIHELLPEVFHDAECWWQLSSSAGFVAGVLKAHLFFWLAEPADNLHIKAVLAEHAPAIDRSPFSAAQPHFIAAPIIEGGHDPIPRRTGWRKGLEKQVVLPVPTPAWRPARPAGTSSGGVAPGVDLIGDGDGLAGFHEPLRTATMRYAKQAIRSGRRNDETLKASLRNAIDAAPRDHRKRPSVADYRGDDYLDRLIAGAFALLSAEPDLRAMQPHHAAPHQTVQQGRDAIAGHVDAFLGRVVDWHRAGKDRPPAEHAALVVGVGVGKSRAAREAMAGFITAARGDGRSYEDKVMEGALPHRVLWTVPTHSLGNEALTAMEDLGLSVAVMRGREARVPGTEDPENGIASMPMCLNLPAVEDAISIGHDVESSVCGSGKPGMPVCPYRGECEYQKQKQAVAKADVVIAAHQALFHRIPAQATDNVGLVIADESWWQVGIITGRDIRLAGFADEPLLYPVLQKGDFHGKGASRSWRMVTDSEDTNDLHVLSAKAQAAFDATPEGELVSRDAALKAGLTVADCAEAAKLEWRRKVDKAIRPGMSLVARAEGVARAAGNASIPRRAGVWKALEELLAGGGSHTGRLEMSSKATADGADRVVLLHSRLDVIEAVADLPILAMDATMPEPVVRHYLPRLNVLANVQPFARHMTVNQILGGWGKTSLIPNDRAAPEENSRRRALGSELLDFVRLNSRGNGLVITYQDLEDRFAAPGIRTGHFNAISGLDTFGDVRSLFVIGRPLPAPAELLTMARALTGLPIAAEAGQVETRGALMADGSGAPVNVRAYADPTLEALRVAITDAEVIQAIGRGRGVNRSADTPLTVFVLADVVLPLPVTRLVRWVDVRPDVLGRMQGRGVVLLGPADAAAAYPDLFPNPDAARKAIGRAEETKSIRTSPYEYSLIGECPDALLIRASYRPKGNGQKTRRALVCPTRLETFPTWIAAICGPLALLEIADPTSPTPAPSSPPQPKPTREEPMPEPSSPDDGIDPARLYRSTVVNLDFVGGVSGLWTVKQSAGREPIRIVDRPVPAHLLRSRLNRITWLPQSGEALPLGVAFLAPARREIHASA
jgi:hypothetical protein